jgi:hypothetical protein
MCATGGRERQGNWANAGGCTRCPGRCKLGPNLGQGYIGPRESVWLRRTANEYTANAPVWSDQFGHAQTICTGPLEMPLRTDLLQPLNLHNHTPDGESTLEHWCPALLNAVPARHRKELNSLVVLTVREPWLYRNAQVFENSPPCRESYTGASRPSLNNGRRLSYVGAGLLEESIWFSS